MTESEKRIFDKYIDRLISAENELRRAKERLAALQDELDRYRRQKRGRQSFI